MFHLTPQERTALAGLLTACLVGGAITIGLHHDYRPLRWVKTTAQKPKPYKPDINTASVDQLDRVPGIGPKTAQAIVDYRVAHGPLLSLDELGRVKGMTKVRLKKVKNFYRDEGTHENP